MRKEYKLGINYPTDYFCITPLESNTTIKWGETIVGSPSRSVNLSYSYDLINWYSYTLGTDLTVNNAIYWKGLNPQGFVNIYEGPGTTNTLVSLTLNKACDLSGCISSLFYKYVASHKALPMRTGSSDQSYSPISFASNSYIHSIKNLIIDLDIDWLSGTYASLFAGCSNLIDTPIFDFIHLYPEYKGKTCQEMFKNCTSLVNAYSVPNIMCNYCFAGMFEGCTSLVNPPALPATTISTSAYEGMFRGCTALKHVPVLPALTVGTRGYAKMFKDCGALLDVPALPATNIDISSKSNFSYAGMFYPDGYDGGATIPQNNVITLLNPSSSAAQGYDVWQAAADISTASEVLEMFYQGVTNYTSMLFNTGGVPIMRNGNTTVRYLSIVQ